MGRPATGMGAETKMATATFSGWASMASARLCPPKLCPTRTTFSLGGAEQRPGVLLERAHLLGAHGAGAARGQVERGDAVAGGFQDGGHLVPAPRAVAEAVHEHEVVLTPPLADLLHP